MLDRWLRYYTFGQLQDMATFLELMENYNISYEELKEYVAARRDAIRQQERAELRLRQATRKPCSNCSGTMVLLPVNDSINTQTGDDSKSVWHCSHCLEQVYNKERFEDIVKGVLNGNR